MNSSATDEALISAYITQDEDLNDLQEPMNQHFNKAILPLEQKLCLKVPVKKFKCFVKVNVFFYIKQNKTVVKSHYRHVFVKFHVLNFLPNKQSKKQIKKSSVKTNFTLKDVDPLSAVMIRFLLIQNKIDLVRENQS